MSKFSTVISGSKKASEKEDSFGIYIHIPFCKQACHYCNYHFSTSLKKKSSLTEALIRELELRKNELHGEVRTVYFGGGTPSLLTQEELLHLLEAIDSRFVISENPEITLEANPDDLSVSKIRELAESGINRLSIGVQSFFNEDLELMNRAHNAAEALSCIKEVKKVFENYTIDLIYGIPGMDAARWENNLKTAFELEVPHLSCYALTVEPRTALKKFIETGKVAPVDEEMAARHHAILLEKTEEAGYINYEFSNFGKPGFESKNNTAYWEGKAYLGIGPSAHSFDGNKRSWNVSNNSIYINTINKGILPSEEEELTLQDHYNEYMMIGLRTKNGVSLKRVAEEFGDFYYQYLLSQIPALLEKQYLTLESGVIKVPKKAMFLTDGISSDLFYV